MARVAIVGAGMGGLASAARLATLGHDVTVYEAGGDVGGKLATYSRGGHTFDTGPSLLTLPAVYRDLFIKTGAPIESVLDLEPVDPVARYRFADGTELDLPNANLNGVARAMGEAFGGTAEQDWRELLDRARAMWAVTREPFLESPLEGTRTLLRLARSARAVRTVAPWQTLRGLGRSYLTDPRQRMILDRYATYSGSDPRKLPATLAVVPYVEQTFGAWYVPGGLHRLGLAVRDRAVERGARVRTGTRVTGITVDGGRVSGLTLQGGESVRADVVVANADAARVYGTAAAPGLLPTGVAAEPRRRLGRTVPSLAGFVLLLALRGRTPGLRHHTVLFPADYDAEFDAIFGRRPQPVPDPTVYVAAPDDPAMRPSPDSESWFVLVNAPRHGSENRIAAADGHGGEDRHGAVDWDAPGVSDAYARRVLDMLAARGHDVRDRLSWYEWRSPADLERATGAPGGAIYGSSGNGARSAFLRPANRSPVPGLFLAGGSAHPGGGLPLVGLSAAIVAELVGRA